MLGWGPKRISLGGMAAACMALAAPARAELVYGVTLDQNLVRWDSASPGTVIGGVAIQGMQSNETVKGIDFRPATQQLYVMGSFSRVYTMNLLNGVATQVAGPGPFAPALNGAQFGMDFNPTVDRLRMVSSSQQNLRIHPTTVGVTNDAALNYAAGDPNFGQDPDIVHAAYTNNFPGATSTTLYGIDSGRDVLVIQNPPNNGTLNTVGAVGTDITEWGGFDISRATGAAFVAVGIADESRSTFWTMNLATGQGSYVGEIGGGLVITAMAVVPEPGTLGLLVIAASVAAGRRRRGA